MTQVDGAIALERRDGIPWAVLHGEVDMDVVGTVGEDILAPFATDGPFHVDVHEVEFIDSSGIAWLLRLRELSSEVHLVGPDIRLKHLLEVSGVGDMFVVDPVGADVND